MITSEISSKTVSNNKVVMLFYSVTNETGDIVDNNEDFEPLEYLHGYNNILPDLEKAIEGMSTDEERIITLEPQQAYGEHDPNLLFTVEREQLGNQVDQLQPGAVVESADGKELIVTRVDNDKITLDGNHPLAGLTLEFKVKVTAIRDASDEELQQGFPKVNNSTGCGPGCCC